LGKEEQRVCTGACLFGKCPYETCIKYAQKKRQAAMADVDMHILTRQLLPAITGDKKGFGIAVDIGTTTVVAYLYRLATCELLGVASRLNAQATLGVDVISRIKYCTDIEDGLGAMQKAIVKELNLLFRELADKAGITPADVSHIVVTGNTTMLHLFAGISPVTMGYSPFTPASTFGYFAEAKDFGLETDTAKVYLADCISSFVGGDITTAILASGMFEGEDLCLLLDIGTNGEVALGSRHGILATSTAAGPAFEGAQLSHGMAGVNGAVNSVYAENGEFKFTTIGGGAPKGICGSGVIDMTALALKTGLVDETGRIAGRDEVPEALACFLTEEGGMPALKIAGDVTLTQKDIREIQTAKAAIAAGVLSLLHHAERDIRDVKKVFLAGGFGNFMDPESAVAIGLLPKEAADRIVPIGNAAGSGAAMALLNGAYLEKCSAIRAVGEHVELGHNAYFMEQYVACMMFEKE
jgi:uncharacterized 2Fe-2S/4Fe-4S cluster protein (DUF4445 family)